MMIVSNNLRTKDRGTYALGDPWRVFEFVDKQPNGCWNTKFKSGSPTHKMMSAKGYKTYVHRVAYQLYYGIKLSHDPKYECVCHKCNNPLCVNPKHLYLGNRSSNAYDSIKAGTFRGLEK